MMVVRANRTGEEGSGNMYYDIVESGLRIRKLRTAANMSMQRLAEEIGISVGAMGKIENGYYGARIDTLICIAEVFHVSLDYLVCGCEPEQEVEGLVTGLNEMEAYFVYSVVKSMVDNMILLRKCTRSIGTGRTYPSEKT